MAVPTVAYARSLGRKLITASARNETRQYCFGGTGLGTADELQNLIDARDWLGQNGGGTIYVPEGDFMFEHETEGNAAFFWLYSNCIVQGAGRDLTKFALSPNVGLNMFKAGRSAGQILDITKENNPTISYAGTVAPVEGEYILLRNIPGMTQLNNTEQLVVVGSLNTVAKTYRIQVDASAYSTFNHALDTWINNHTYTAWTDFAYDATTQTLYQCQVTHTTPNDGSTFATERAGHSTYWGGNGYWRNRIRNIGIKDCTVDGQWATHQAYTACDGLTVEHVKGYVVQNVSILGPRGYGSTCGGATSDLYWDNVLVDLTTNDAFDLHQDDDYDKELWSNKRCFFKNLIAKNASQYNDPNTSGNSYFDLRGEFVGDGIFCEGPFLPYAGVILNGVHLRTDGTTVTERGAYRSILKNVNVFGTDATRSGTAVHIGGHHLIVNGLNARHVSIALEFSSNSVTIPNAQDVIAKQIIGEDVDQVVIVHGTAGGAKNIIIDGIEGDTVTDVIKTVTGVTPSNIKAAGIIAKTVTGSVFNIGSGTTNFTGEYDHWDASGTLLTDAGTGTTIKGPIRSGSATYDPISLADGAGVTTTVTVTGAALGDTAVASFSLDIQGITLTAWVSSANTVSVRFQNESGGLLDLASGTLRARVNKWV